MNWDTDLLLQAVELNDAQQVARVFEEAKATGQTINPQWQATAVITAIMQGKAACVRALMAQTPPDLIVRSPTKVGRTSLLGLAVDVASPHMLRVLLEYCNPQWQSEQGETVLMRAIREKDNNHLEEFLDLLLPVSNVNQRAADGSTALLHAARALSLPAIQRLIELNGKENARGNGGKNALMLVLAGRANRPKIECLRLLMPVSDPKELDPRSGYTALQEATKNGDVEAVKLLSTFCDVNKKDKYGETALMMAAGAADVEVVKCLAPLTDCTFRNDQGEDALALACDTLRNTADQRVFEILKAFPAQTREQHSPLISSSIAAAHALHQSKPYYSQPQQSPRFMELSAEYERWELAEILAKHSKSALDAEESMETQRAQLQLDELNALKAGAFGRVGKAKVGELKRNQQAGAHSRPKRL